MSTAEADAHCAAWLRDNLHHAADHFWRSRTGATFRSDLRRDDRQLLGGPPNRASTCVVRDDEDYEQEFLYRQPRNLAELLRYWTARSKVHSRDGRAMATITGRSISPGDGGANANATATATALSSGATR
jgi:hypothetical protein